MAEIKDSSIQKDKEFTHPSSSDISLYSNGFIGGQTAYDMYIIGMLNSNPNFTLNMSYTTAKNLQSLMNRLISDFESSTGLVIPTSQEIGKKLTLSKGEGHKL
jgi:hypothetical protein